MDKKKYGIRHRFLDLVYGWHETNRKLFIFYALGLHTSSVYYVHCTESLLTTGVETKMIFNVNSSRDLKAYPFLLL